VSFISGRSDLLPLASFFAGKLGRLFRPLKMSTVTLMQGEKWLDLCWEAMHEKNVDKLLMMFLELDRATAGKPLELLSETVREYRHDSNKAGYRLIR
jgi:hypothetical protein